MKLGEVVVRPLEAGESGLRIMHDICELSIIMDIEFLFSKYHGINTWIMWIIEKNLPFQFHDISSAT